MAYLNTDCQVEPAGIYHNHSHDGLNRQGDKGVDSEHQGIAFHAQINCNLESIIKYSINILTITYIRLLIKDRNSRENSVVSGICLNLLFYNTKAEESKGIKYY